MKLFKVGTSAFLGDLASHAGEVRRALEKPPEEPKVEERGDLLSTGSTLLNLAIADSPTGGYMAGKYFYLVGDSASGKTFLSMTCMAEATRNPAFQNHRLILDNVEDGMLMDVDRFFGREVAARLESPAHERDGTSKFSETIEEFYYHVDDAVKKGKPFIYVLDSMDGLESGADQVKFEELKKAHQSGKTTSGSYGMDKAKKNSIMLRKVIAGLRKSKSILIIISQTRDAVNTMGWGETKTRSGGRALRFYATCEIWTSIVGSIKKTIRGKPRKIGNHIQVQVKKNRITGKLHTITTAIYPSYGIDDVGSCVDFLIEEGWWPKKGPGKYHVTGTETVATREKLIKIHEQGIGPRRLLKAVRKCWDQIEAESILQRSPRYARGEE